MKPNKHFFSYFNDFILEDSDIKLTPRQKISEIAHKQADLKDKIRELSNKKKDKPEQRQLIDLQIQLDSLKIQELDLQKRIATLKL